MKKVLTLVLTFVMVLALTACGNTAVPEEGQVIKETETTVTNSEKSEPEDEAEISDDRGIPGSHITDLIVGTQQNGFPEHNFKSSEDKTVSAHYSDSSYTNPDTSDILNYSASCDEDFEIIQASFEAVYGGITTIEEFTDYAASFLVYGASMPYDTYDQDAAMSFIKENISLADISGSCTTTIGDATLTLFGNVKDTTAAYWVHITKAE